MLSLLIGLILTSPPVSASPDRVAWTAGDLAEVIDLAVGPGGLAVVMADPAGGRLAALDLRTWELDTASTCPGSVGAAPWVGDDEVRVYAGCDDGVVTWAVLDDGGLTASGESVDIEDGSVVGLIALDDLLYVLTEPDDGANPTLHSLDPSSGTVDGESGFPSTLGHSGYADIETNGTYLFVLHGGDNLSKVDPSTGNAVTEQEALGVLDGVDLVTQTTGTHLYGAGGSAVAWYDLSGNDWSLYLDSGDGLQDVDAICLLEDDEQLLVADGGADSFKLFSYDSGSKLFGDDVQDSWPFATSGAVVSEMVTVDGYAVAGTEDGELWVMPAGPWVDISSVDPSVAIAGDTVSLSFTSDRDGSYELRVGGDTDTDGTQVAEGEVTADTSTTVQVTVGEDFAEGKNQVRVVVTDSGGDAGHDAGVVTVDNPPDRISLTDDSVGFGNQGLTLSFTTPDAEDISKVRVYLSVTEFSREDWSSGGGPDFDGDDAISASDLEFDVTPAQAVELVISPLTNDTTYYLAVRAYDDGGLEGPMSTVVSGTPEQTYGIVDLTGEQGGFCGTPGAASVGLGLFGLALAGLRRRRVVLTAAALHAGVTLGSALLCTPAQAGDDPDLILQGHVRGNTQLRVGPMWFDEGNAVSDVLGATGHNVLWLETGPSWRGYAQFTVGAGFYRKKGLLVTDSGVPSTQEDLMWAVPLTANLSLRLDVLEEQIIVPYLTGGGDLWLWREKKDLNFDGDSVAAGGGKWGYHYGAGGQLLLDSFERGRAGLAFSRLGIKDSYLTGEWRRQQVGVFQDGLDLSNDQVTLGLSLHY